MKKLLNSRRDFIKKAAVGTALIAGLPEIISAAMPPAKTKKLELSKDNVILFQGDSITDSGRNREDNSFNNPRILGSGYPLL
ncbi:MAG: twin-arginine translocation signal domain-containing protein, partial [Bacteroidales bacterium]|nr:twin-arginine translocation signal domain-containing protein [Bacteroidales bacterium]